MKKYLDVRCALATYALLALSVGCGKNSPSPVNCSNNAVKVSEAAQAYAVNPSTAACQNYKNSISDFYKSCRTYYTGASKQALDEALSEPCP